MGDFEVVKFKANESKAIGIVLCTPLCGIVFNLLVNNYDAGKDEFFVLKLFIAACLFIYGCFFLAQANERVDDYVRSNR